ncbi:MAG: hypothetical protein ACN6OB_05300 [Chryseobacterium jejuense]|uniref:hypothetical protein n=1 Tax=Chryseobacterium jejuense TaxID=445960 RepID=UPI003D11FE20
MKTTLIFTLGSILVLFSCKAQDKKIDPKIVIPFIESYIDFKNKEHYVNVSDNILIVGANKIQNENKYWLNVYFMNPELMSGFKYTKVYKLYNYRIIIDEALDETIMLKNAFKNIQEVPYENFNLASYPFSYNTSMWLLTFNYKNEVIQVSPQEKAETIKNILEKKGIKFSKDYEE